MGKRRFAGTLTAADHRTASEKFSSQDLTCWIRGWDEGIEVVARVEDGEDCFEIYTAGGSTGGRGNGRTLIGKYKGGEFIRRN